VRRSGGTPDLASKFCVLLEEALQDRCSPISALESLQQAAARAHQRAPRSLDGLHGRLDAAHAVSRGGSIAVDIHRRHVLDMAQLALEALYARSSPL
jgi:hypothetical protein